MTALILAAGFGKRLQPLTNQIPKCLVEVNGVHLIVNALTCLKKNGIKKVVIVVGHMKEVVYNQIGSDFLGLNITYVENNIYDQTNNVYSLWLARDYLNSDVIMLECDLFFKENLISKVLESDAACGILTSPFNSQTMDGTVLDVDKKNNVKKLTINRDQGSEFNFSGKKKTVNIYRFSKSFLIDHYLPLIDFYIKNEGVNSYYELVLGALIYLGGNDIQSISVPEDLWCEIDTVKDLEHAKTHF